MKVQDGLGKWREVPKDIEDMANTVLRYMAAHGIEELAGLHRRPPADFKLPIDLPDNFLGFQRTVAEPKKG
jgi:hypothetical protein